MTKYSRTSKYEELRNQLQNNTDTEIKSRELSRYASRLNRIDSDNFSAPESTDTQDHDPIHARRREYLEKTEAAAAAQPTAAESPFRTNENDTTTNTFDNDYLNQYIREVKQYNMDQGNAYSTDTNLNVLKSLRGEQQPAPRKPYPDETRAAVQDTRRYTAAAAAPQVTRKVSTDTTADIPFMGTAAKPAANISMPFVQPSAANTGVPYVQPAVQPLSQTDTQTFTKEDIANEVQSMVNNDASLPKSSAAVPAGNTTEQHIQADRTARQQLLNETTQMRAQMDDYEDNLNEFNDKMKHQNRILNFVLVVLILALIVVLGVVVYWILLSRGTI